MAHDFLLLQSVPLYAKDHPRPWMRWMLERKKMSRHRNIETGQPVVLLFSSSWWGGGKRSHGTGACLLLPATEPAAFLRKLKVQVFPSPCGAGQNKALDWLKLLPSNSEVFFKGGLSRKSFFQLPTPKVAGAKWQNKCW